MPFDICWKNGRQLKKKNNNNTKILVTGFRSALIQWWKYFDDNLTDITVILRNTQYAEKKELQHLTFYISLLGYTSIVLQPDQLQHIQHFGYSYNKKSFHLIAIYIYCETLYLFQIHTDKVVTNTVSNSNLSRVHYIPLVHQLPLVLFTQKYGIQRYLGVSTIQIRNA